MKSLIFTFFAVALLTIISKAQLTSTNLPIVILTSTSAINDTQKQAAIKIIDNISGVNTPLDAAKFNGMIGLKLRGGNAYPKSSYSVETWSSPFTSLDTSLMALPSENDWVLLASYVDRSLMRNLLTNQLHEKMGRYAPRFKLCELIVDNQYKGVYLFGEKIKRDTNRVDIANLKNIDISGDQLTGGYIFTIDNGNTGGWTSAIAPPYGTTGQTINFLYEVPDASVIQIPQKLYIKSYVDSFEAALNSTSFQDTVIGWRKFGAENSFIDYMIMNELSKDYEGYRKNTYVYKDKLGKLKTGPMWGNEIAWGNTTDCNSNSATGWAYEAGNVCNTNSKLAPFWWGKLATDVAYMKALKCRYTEYRKVGNLLDTTKIFKTIDSIATRLNANGAIARNFTQWPIWNVPLVNEPTPMSINHAEEVTGIKNFIRTRIAWLDNQWFSTNCVYPTNVHNSINENEVMLYPIPTPNMVNIDLKIKESVIINLLSIEGKKLMTMNSSSSKNTIDLSSYKKGIYFIEIKCNDQVLIKKVIKE
jgi:hypothetical protein